MPSPDSIQESIADVESVLGADLYVFADDRNHLLGETVLVGAAGALLGTFLKGFVAGVRGELEKWGQQAGESLARRIRALITGADGAVADDAALYEIADTARSVAASSSASSTAALEQTTGTMVVVLTSAGMSEQAAVRYARALRQAAEPLLADG